jgi:RNA polymerase primary sigma factor
MITAPPSPARYESLDILSSYLNEIGRETLLNRETEVELARAARAGNRAALDRLVTANLRFVVKIANQFRNRGLPLEDLIGEGNVGLIKAAHRFDETKGVRFISYAVWWIRQSILKAVAEANGVVRYPQYKSQEIKRVKRVAREIENREHREARVEEIAERLELSPETVEHDLMLGRAHLSLDAPVSGEGDSPLMDFIETTFEDQVEAKLTEESLGRDVLRALSTLAPRQARVITLYFGLEGETPRTLQAIGDEFGCTKENIRLIKEKALGRLRMHSRRHLLEHYLEN